MSMISAFRRWYDYEKDSHAKVLASLHSVPENKRSSEAFLKACSLLGHMIAARQLWLFRFGIASEPPRDFFPMHLTLDELATREKAVETAWSAYLDRLDDAEFDRAFEYQSLDGCLFRNTIGEILTQLFGHSWYHRGQIASLVRTAGGEPAATDYVYWARQPIPAPH